MTKCKYCGSDTIEIPDFDGADSYGEFHHVCKVCGAVGQEVFGHGIYWNQGKVKEVNKINSNKEIQCDAEKSCCFKFTDKCKRCMHNRGPKQDDNCFVPY